MWYIIFAIFLVLFARIQPKYREAIYFFWLLALLIYWLWYMIVHWNTIFRP